jgi:hypothetical protein
VTVIKQDLFKTVTSTIKFQEKEAVIGKIFQQNKIQGKLYSTKNSAKKLFDWFRLNSYDTYVGQSLYLSKQSKYQIQEPRSLVSYAKKCLITW